MIAGLQSFCRLIQRRTSMSSIRSRSGLKDVIGNFAGFRTARIRQIVNTISYGYPRLHGKQRSFADSIFNPFGPFGPLL